MTDSHTTDSHIEIDGRRWRASDPSIPESFRSELVHELMAARRAVGAAGRADDDAAMLLARARVQDAKVALGERGPTWWNGLSDDDLRVRMEATMRALLCNRASTSTICPSDVARAAASPGWRNHMDTAREVAAMLHDAGTVEVRQGGERVEDPLAARGPLRIARGERAMWPSDE